MTTDPLFDIVAFQVPRHKSLIYKMWLTESQLLEALSDAIAKGANVVSIRHVEKESPINKHEIV